MAASLISHVSPDTGRYLIAAQALVMQGNAVAAGRQLQLAVTAYFEADRSGDLSAGRRFLLEHWPDLGIELRQRADGSVECIIPDPASLLEVATCLRHLIRSLSLDQRRSWIWSLYALPGRLTTPWIESLRLRLSANRQGRDWQALQTLLQWLEFSLQPRSPGYRAYLSLLAWQTGCYLREPLAAARRIVAVNQRHIAGVDSRRLQWCSPARRKQQLAATAWPQRRDYLALQAVDRRSRVIAAFHLGDFVTGLESFSAATLRQRRRCVIRFQDHDHTLRQHRLADAIERHRDLPEMVNSQHFNPLDAVAFLRAGNANLTIFCDLPPGHGESTTVEFLGRPARFPRGAAEIALLSRVPILPVVCITTASGNRLELPGLIEARSLEGETMEGSARRLTQLLVSILEHYLIRFPAQWYYLPRLNSYFVSDAGLDPLHA